jgi:RNA polymerase sigma-70 factor (ECF subfamily)
MSPLSERREAEAIAKRFEGLLAPLLGAAYGTAFHMARDRDDAEDLVQEAAVRAFRSFHTFQEGTNFKAWFFRILTNLFLEKHRQKQREPQTVDLEDPPVLYLYSQTRQAGLHAWSADPAALVLRQMENDQVSAAIAALPEDYRTVCALYLMQDLSYQEISEILDCPVGTVRSRLHRGRKALQVALWDIVQEQGIPVALSAGAS